MKKMLVIVLSAMWILDVKAMKAQKMLIVHCCKQHEKNTSDGFEVFFILLPFIVEQEGCKLMFFFLLHLTCARRRGRGEGVLNFFKNFFSIVCQLLLFLNFFFIV